MNHYLPNLFELDFSFLELHNILCYSIYISCSLRVTVDVCILRVLAIDAWVRYTYSNCMHVGSLLQSRRASGLEVRLFHGRLYSLFLLYVDHCNSTTVQGFYCIEE
jgi:hypothetical protein